MGGGAVAGEGMGGGVTSQGRRHGRRCSREGGMGGGVTSQGRRHGRRCSRGRRHGRRCN